MHYLGWCMIDNCSHKFVIRRSLRFRWTINSNIWGDYWNFLFLQTGSELIINKYNALVHAPLPFRFSGQII